MKLIDKVLWGVFTSYKEYLQFKEMRDCVTAIDPEVTGSSRYLSNLDPDEESTIDSMIYHSLAVGVVKGTFSRDYCQWVMDAYEARRALIRKHRKKEDKK